MADEVITEITTTARRIARAHNAACCGKLSGGLLVFDREGRGGEWYSGEVGYRFAAEVLVFRVRWRRVSEREVQEWLDGMAS